LRGTRLEPAAASRWRQHWPVLCVAAVALVLAVVQYARFLPAHDALWFVSTHDRNSHYLLSLKLVADVRHGNLFRLAADINSAQVWPPFQDLVAAGVMLIGSADDRLAVLPSLAGWVLALVFTFLVARRIVPRGGTLAGLVAVLFLAASPAHRAFSVDVMLESLGAGLTLIALFAYLGAVQDPANSGRAGRRLAVVLTILFVHKYNYWLLVALALTATEVLVHRRALWTAARRLAGSVDWRGMLRLQLRTPTNYVVAALVVLIAFVYQHADRPVEWRGGSFGVYPPYNFMQFAYWIVFARLVLWWRSSGSAWADALEPRIRAVIRWHVWPAACWMALPRHVGPFLWYLSTAQGPETHPGMTEGLRRYAAWAVSDYHLSLACLLTATGLLAVALVTFARLKRGGAAVVVFFLLALLLTVRHPNQQARFLTTWITAGWILAGAGAAMLVYGRLTDSVTRLRPAFALVVLAAIAVIIANGNLSASVYYAGPQPQMPSLRDVTDDYLPDLGGDGPVAIVSDVEIRPLHQWTFLERYGQISRLDDRVFGFGTPGAENQAGFRAWLQSTRCETVVFIDTLPTPEAVTQWEIQPNPQVVADYRAVFAEQTTLCLVRRRDFPKHGCAVLVWKRRG
jgi:hypothetical protein